LPIVAASRLSTLLEQARSSQAELRRIDVAEKISQAKSFREIFADSLNSATLTFNATPNLDLPPVEQLDPSSELLTSSHTFLDRVLHNIAFSLRNQGAVMQANNPTPEATRKVEHILDLLHEMTYSSSLSAQS
jgi:hypothetical protein